MQYGSNKWVGIDSMCKTYHTVNIDETTKECRFGDTSNDTSEEALRRDNIENTCGYKSYPGSDNSTFDDKTDSSKCGFNNITSAYCQKRRGDTWCLSALQQYSDVNFTVFNCHPSSNIENCKDFNDVTDDWKLKFEQALLEVDSDRSYALYASNDVCVANTVTVGYWQGTHPDDSLAAGRDVKYVFFLIVGLLTFCLVLE